MWLNRPLLYTQAFLRIFTLLRALIFIAEWCMRIVIEVILMNVAAEHRLVETIIRLSIYIACFTGSRGSAYRSHFGSSVERFLKQNGYMVKANASVYICIYTRCCWWPSCCSSFYIYTSSCQTIFYDNGFSGYYEGTCNFVHTRTLKLLVAWFFFSYTILIAAKKKINYEID